LELPIFIRLWLIKRLAAQPNLLTYGIIPKYSENYNNLEVFFAEAAKSASKNFFVLKNWQLEIGI